MEELKQGCWVEKVLVTGSEEARAVAKSWRGVAECEGCWQSCQPLESGRALETSLQGQD